MLNFALMRNRLTFPALLLATIALAAQNTSEVELTAEPHHHLVIENEYVRVFRVEVAPHDSTLMHSHHHDYVFITLGNAEVENAVKGKPPVILKLQDGEARFVPGNFAHVARNLADTPFRNVTIELLQDEAARKTPPPKWDEFEMSPTAISLGHLARGTRDIYFNPRPKRIAQPGADPIP